MNKYELLKQIGEGAYGIVCKAREKATGELVAIKTFKDNSDQELTIQNRELETTIAVSSPYVVECIESFRDHGQLHLVFEFAPGVNLQEHINAHPNGLPKDEVKRFCYELCEAVRSCHRAKIIHRDIKPENLLLDKNKRLKLCDFGVARVIDGPGVPLSNYVATRWYRPPELELRSNQYSFSADVWSIGAILVEMASGYPLFPGESSIDQLHLIEELLGPIPHVPGAKVVKKLGGDAPGKRKDTQSTPGMQQLDRESSAGSSRSAAGDGKWNTTAKLKKKFGYFLGVQGIAFLEETLRLVPSERLSADELLKQPYLEKHSSKGTDDNEIQEEEFLEEEVEDGGFVTCPTVETLHNFGELEVSPVAPVQESPLNEATASDAEGAEAAAPRPPSLPEKRFKPPPKADRADRPEDSDEYYSDNFEEPPSPCHSPSPGRSSAAEGSQSKPPSSMSEAAPGEASMPEDTGRRSAYTEARPVPFQPKKGAKSRKKGNRDASPAPSTGSASSGEKSLASKGSLDEAKQGTGARRGSRDKGKKEKKEVTADGKVDFGSCMKFAGSVTVDNAEDVPSGRKKSHDKGSKGPTKEGRKKMTRKNQ